VEGRDLAAGQCARREVEERPLGDGCLVDRVERLRQDRVVDEDDEGLVR
jgi:hypothetical protein